MDLQREYFYKTNTTISREELVTIGYKLLETYWSVRYRNESHIVNLAKLGWTVSSHNKKSALGSCNPRTKQVLYSEAFYKTNPDRSHDWEEILRHEVAHALDFSLRGISNHDQIWKSFARQVLAKEKSASQTFNYADAPFKLVCPNCGKEVLVSKTRRRDTACSECCRKYNNGEYDAKYKMALEVNENYGKSMPVVKKVESTPIKRKSKYNSVEDILDVIKINKVRSLSHLNGKFYGAYAAMIRNGWKQQVIDSNLFSK